jgi:hypothetical protein
MTSQKSQAKGSGLTLSFDKLNFLSMLKEAVVLSAFEVGVFS